MDPLSFALIGGLAIAAGVALATFRPDVIVHWCRTVLSISFLVSLGAVLMVVRLDPPGFRIEIDPSSEPLIPAGDPGREAYREAVLDFGSDDVYVVAMAVDDDVFTRENLEALRRVTNEIRRIRGVRNAESLVNVHSFSYEEEHDWIEVGRFIDEIPTDPAQLAELRKRALENFLYRKTMISDDGRATAINITFRTMSDREFIGDDLDGQIRRVLEAETTPGRRFFVTGRPHIRSRAHHLMIRDLITLIPLAILVAALVGFTMTGSLRGTLLVLINCLTATLWAYGAMGAVDKDLNLITLVLGPTLICVGSVYGVHVMARYEAISVGCQTPREAAYETLHYVREPVLMAGFTTCVGFGALLLADVPATTELGAFSVLGVASVTLLSMTAVPATLALLPLEGAGRETSEPLYEGRGGAGAWVGRRIEITLRGIGRIETSFPTAVLVGWGVVTAAGAVMIPRIVIDTDFLTFFRPDSDVRTDFAEVNRLLTGAGVLYVTLEGQGEGTFREPETLRSLREIQGQIERLEGVSEVLSMVDFLVRAQSTLEGVPPERAELPDSRAGVAEFVFMIPKDRLRRFATSNHSSSNLVVRTGRVGSAAMRVLEADIRKVLANGSLPDGLRPGVTGNSVLLNRSADGVARNQLNTVGSAALTIFVLMWFVYRSLRLALLAMIPNVVPVIVFFGVLGIGAAPLSLPTGLIGAITLGIAIDDTVHFLAAYQRERANGSPPEEASRYCMRTVGRPIVITSVMLIVGFSVMLISEFVTLGQFGALAAMTMAVCLSTDLGLLPALLVRFRA